MSLQCEPQGRAELPRYDDVLQLMPCHMCASAIVQFGIARVVAGETSNFREANGFETLLRHGIEVIDLDLDDARHLLGRFIEANPEQWNEDIGT